MSYSLPRPDVPRVAVDVVCACCRKKLATLFDEADPRAAPMDRYIDAQTYAIGNSHFMRSKCSNWGVFVHVVGDTSAWCKQVGGGS